MAGLQSDKSRMMIDLVIWAQYINVTDAQTATSPWQMRANALRQAAKTCLRQSHAEIMFRESSLFKDI